MITIALDEQGDFENLQGELDTKPVFIGGVIYDDLDDLYDLKNEKERLTDYLKKVCEKVGGKYPEDLHWSNDKSRNGIVTKVKEQFSKTAREFFENGTFDGKSLHSYDRKGNYHIFAIVRGDDGKKYMINEGLSQFVKDDFASNLYIHMAEDVVSRLVFHNPVLNSVEKVGFELATRSVFMSEEQLEEVKNQYKLLGFQWENRPEIDQKKPYYIRLTNPYNYRTALERESLTTDKKHIKLDHLAVKSIYYHEEGKDMMMLYLADLVCSHLGFNCDASRRLVWAEDFKKKCDDINPYQNLVWAYDEVDDYFAKAIKRIEDRDYYGALSAAFDGMTYHSPITDYYKKNWFCTVYDAILKEQDLDAFILAVRKFKQSIDNHNVHQDKLIFIFKQLRDISKTVDYKHNKNEAVLYELYDAGLSAYMRTTNYKEGQKCFRQIEKYAEYVPIEELLKSRNKMVVLLLESQQYESALELAKDNVDMHVRISDMKKSLYGECFSESLNHAKALVKLGQVYAFMEDERAEQYFLDAIEMMDEGTPEEVHAQGFLLHYYITMNQEEKYRVLAKEYFGGNETLETQFMYVITEGSRGKKAKFSLNRALNVFVKALCVFYIDEIPPELLKKLRKIESSMRKIKKNSVELMDEHPWELIYKYLGIIMILKGKMDEADTYIKCIEENFDMYEGLVKDIKEVSIASLKNYKEGKVLKEKYTYMYC